MSLIEVILADDHPVVRAGVRKLLEGFKDVKVVAEAENGREAVRLALDLKPDLVFMDISMPELNGLEATEMIRRDAPEVRVVVLSVHSSIEYAIRALRQAGASGYLPKDASPDDFETAIRAVMQDGVYLGPHVARQFVHQILQDTDGEASPLGSLSLRQREVLQLIAEGRRNREIADMLHLSVKTVESHRAKIMEELDIHDVAGLVRFAIRTGLTSAED